MFRFRRWWLLCGAVLVGVVALNGVADDVVDAHPVAASRTVCVRGGAKARDGVSGRGLVCVQTKVRGLRWQFQPTTVTTTTTTTTTSPSTTTTTTVPGVAAPVLVSVSASDGVQITVAGMRPDTGVYSLQWVPYGQSFNTYQMARATSPSMSVPAGWFACNRTYTFRVFVMQAGWQLADGHQIQNVTPHSTPFDVVMPACPTPVVACADGGVCAVGDTGPGGGVVYILSNTSGNTTGLTFEAARNDWDGAAPDGTARWCSVSNASIAGLGTAIGTGSSNSATIATTCASTGALDAAEYVRGKTIGGRTDWFLPSRDEALAMYTQRSVFIGNYAINQLSPDTARYLTSTQGANVLNALGAFLQGSLFPGESGDFSKNFNFSVRPVRSFTAGT